MGRLTVAAAERQLRKAVHVCIVRQHPLPDATAQVDIHNTPHLLLIDPLRGALLDSLVHELIHVAYLDELAAWGAFEEPIVESMEDTIVRYINRSPARLLWWRRRLEGLLENN